MLPYQERVVEEKNQLADRRSKLELFLANDNLTSHLDQTDLKLLHEQYRVMLSYERILLERIARFQ